jgi:hypothetical protein
MWTEAHRVETEAIACELDGLKKRAEARELRLIAFLIDIALSEARDELAQGASVTQRNHFGFPTTHSRVGAERLGPARLRRQRASTGRVTHDPAAGIIVFRQPRGRA